MEFLSSSADIAIMGGAAGGGKTFALLMEPTRHIHNPKFGGVIFRNTYAQITMEGGLWEESEAIYPGMGAVSNLSQHLWRFPSGARIRFGYLQSEKDKLIYLGAQIPYIGFDQLEQISGSSFFYMLSRNRSMSGVRGYVRGSCNPDPESWLADFVSWWIDDDGYADLSKSGVLRWFVRSGEELIWADSPEELSKYGAAKSVTFVPSTVYDNPILLETDPDYLTNLQVLLPIDKARLLGDPERGGNWKIKAGAGMIFDRNWFRLVPVIPQGGRAVLYWDFASTEKELTKKNDPDYTAGVLMIEVGGQYWWAKTVAFRLGPAETDARFTNESLLIAHQMRREGRQFSLRWEIEGGSAGKLLNARLMAEFPDLDAQGIVSSGDKIVRAKPLAQQALVGNVNMLVGDWTERTLEHLHNQPNWPHDDIMDGGSGAFNELVGATRMMVGGQEVKVPADAYKGNSRAERVGRTVPTVVRQKRQKIFR
jgi:phage terminase large subunit-like protein